jgi:hypothetical protein
MKKLYQPGVIIRTLATGLEGVIIDTESHFSGSYTRYIVEMRYGETILLGAEDFADKDDSIHSQLDAARLGAKGKHNCVVYLAKDNVRGELVMLQGDKQESYLQIAEANGVLTLYRELNICVLLNADRTTIQRPAKSNGSKRNIQIDVRKVRILLNWEDAVSRHSRYFDTVEELAVFFRSNCELARAVGYITGHR